MTAKEANSKSLQNYKGDDYDFIMKLVEEKTILGEFSLEFAGTISEKTKNRLKMEGYEFQIIGWSKYTPTNRISWYVENMH